ncbi:MAG: virulence-associated E family protein [Thermoplasmataceae archaeon]
MTPEPPIDPPSHEPPPPTDEHAPAQLSLLNGGAEGGPVCLPYLSNSLASACRILRQADLRARILGPGPLEFNEMTGQVELDRAVLNDRDILRFREQVELHVRGTGQAGKQRLVHLTSETVRDGLATVASERSYHPVREYLLKVRDEVPDPDGFKAIGGVLSLPAGLPRLLLRKWAIGCVARAFQPGCFHKAVLVLVGPQNAGKSSFFREMAGERWFADTDMDLRRENSYLQLHSAWIYEWSELSSMRSAEHARVKAFVSSPTDTFRAPYGHAVERHPRTTVIVGSTEEAFLSDTAGNVRYWPLAIERRLDLRLLQIDRDNFWAEATAAYHLGEEWWLGPDEATGLSRQQADFEQAADDSWAEIVGGWLASTTREIVTVRAVLEEAIKMPAREIGRSDEMRAAAVLRNLGWAKGRRRQAEGVRVVPWVRPAGGVA